MKLKPWTLKTEKNYVGIEINNKINTYIYILKIPCLHWADLYPVNPVAQLTKIKS